MQSPFSRGMNLRAIYQRAETPEAGELDGAYQFEFLTFPIPWFSHLKWRKRFDAVRGVGYNEIRHNLSFGHFQLGGGEDSGALRLDYEAAGAGLPFSALDSQVRRVEHGAYIGRLGLSVLGRNLRLGWFVLWR